MFLAATSPPPQSTATIGVAPHEAGTASGLLNSSRQIGASLGLAALGTVAAHRTGPSSTLHALTAGYALGLTLSAGLLLAAVLIALTVLRRTSPTPPVEQAETQGAAARAVARARPPAPAAADLGDTPETLRLPRTLPSAQFR